TTEANGALKAITVNSNAKIPIRPLSLVRGGAVDTEPANGPGLALMAVSVFVFKVPPGIKHHAGPSACCAEIV
ncbi:hypothetical protein ACIPY2_21615, partial [Paenarthrobacter sp. NPDC089675]|uniref:hypothetical protein n=1 Tax=Paenarthrobacter sp. NPDC089675 TaxID=3364376 RepID=UPI0038197A04